MASHDLHQSGDATTPVMALALAAVVKSGDVVFRG
jgi:hypothetical protein